MIAALKVGQSADIVVLRDGRKQNFKVRIAKREDEKLVSKQLEEEPESTLGIRVENLTPEMAQRFNITETSGVIVADVKSDSKGAEAGVMVGDIIKEVNHTDIKSVDDYVAAIDKVENGGTVQMFIKRINAGFLVIKLTK